MNRRKFYSMLCFVGSIAVGTISLFKASLFAPVVTALYVCAGCIIASREDGDA